MPAYPWLAGTLVDAEVMPKKLTVLRTLGHPYSDEQIKNAAEEVKGKTEMDALIAYLQSLGLALKDRRS
jgi:cytochrome c oxidase cbb3-type subunit 2